MKNFIYSRYNPYLTIALLAILGSSVAFMVLGFLFWVRSQGADWQVVRIPIMFWISGFVLIICGFMLEKAQKCFFVEQYKESYRLFSAGVFCVAVFGICQLVGWYQLLSAATNSTAHLFVILLSILHFLHIIVGVFGLFPIWNNIRKNQTHIDGYLQSLDAALRAKMKAVVWYWHFLDLLWWFLLVVIS